MHLYKSGKLDAATALQMLADAATQKSRVNEPTTPALDNAVVDTKESAEESKKRPRSESGHDQELDDALDGEECQGMDTILNYVGNDFLFVCC